MSFQGYARFPSIRGQRIVFTAEDDLWLVGLSGGQAERLTAGVAEAAHPHISPEGTHIAFTGRDEGPAEVYIMPLDGGESRRLTYQGGNAIVVGWTPDGDSIVFSSGAGQPRSWAHVLYTVSRAGGEPHPMPYGVANALSYGPGDALVLGRNIREPSYWKRYRGGTAGYLWVDATGDRHFKRLLNFNTNVSSPCWIGDRIYFISDHEGIGNVYSCLPSGEDLRRHTSHQDYYARNLASDGERLVYHAGGDLFILDSMESGSRRLAVELTGTRSQRARKFVAAGKYLDSWSPNHDGRRIAISSRGKAYSMDVFTGPVLQHGAGDGVRYRLLTWLAGGKHLVGIRDDGTEPRLAILSSEGAEPETLLENLDIGTVAELRASPVDETVALLNHRCEIMLVDLTQRTATVIERSPYARSELSSHVRGCAWSPDGRWIAYAFAVNRQQTALKLYHVPTGEIHQVTDPVLHDTRPAFDPNGKYLYFLSARDFDPVTDNLHFAWGFPSGVRPFLLTLQRNVQSPFEPAIQSQANTSTPSTEPAEGATAAAVSPIQIDLDGISSRIVAFPVPEGRYGRVQGTHEGVVFSSFPIEGTRKQQDGGFIPASNGTLESYHFAGQQA